MLAARLAKAFPSLSAYSAAFFAEELCKIERAQRRHTESQCSVQGYDEARGDRRIARMLTTWRYKVANMVERDDDAIRNCIAADLAINTELHGDPRGAVLKVQFPNEREALAV